MKSENRWLWIFALLLLSGVCTPAIAQEAEEAAKEGAVAEEAKSDEAGKALLAELQEKSIKAVGGKEALEKYSNRKMSSKVKIADAGLEADLTLFVDSQGNYRESMVITGYGNFQQGINGDVAWSLDPINGPRLVTGKEKEQLLRSARLQPNLWLTRDHQSATLAGEETIGEIACTIYDLKTNDGAVHKYWVANDDGLVRKVSMTVESPMGQIPIQVRMSEYKAVDGIQYPHKMSMKQGVQNMEVTLTTLEHDAEVDAEMLTLPEQVKKLVERSKPKEEETVEEPQGDSAEESTDR